MYNLFMNISGPTVWIVSSLELLMLVFLVYKTVKTKSLLLYLTCAITCGLFYDAFITSLGTVVDANNMLFLSHLRYYLHAILVPLLFLISSLAIELKKPYKIAVGATTLVFIILGIVCMASSTYKVIDFAGISRLVVDKDLTNKAFTTIPTVVNVIAVLPLIGVGIYVLIKEKNVYLLLSGGLMFFFSMIGPILKLTDFLFLISMFGEICMILFIILYYLKKEKKEE